MPPGYSLAARVATATTSDVMADAGGGAPMLTTSTRASINGPVMNARLAYTGTFWPLT